MYLYQNTINHKKVVELIRMKTKLFLSFILLVFLYACVNKKEKVQSIEDLEWSELKKQELIADSVNHQDDLYHYPDIISKSIRKLKLVKHQWIHQAILCSRKEKFLILRKVNDSRFIAISTEEKENYQSTFRFYDFNIDGSIIHKSTLPDSDYRMDNRFNLQIDQDFVYYYASGDSDSILSYSLIDHTHKSCERNKLNWQLINDWKNESRYSSGDMKSEILLMGTQLILSKENQVDDTLINQRYDGTWSFRQGTWNEDDSKFYFDNSGAVACIWEIDLVENTLDKIVADHSARAPVYVDEENGAIVYCNENCVYITRKEEYNPK